MKGSANSLLDKVIARHTTDELLFPPWGGVRRIVMWQGGVYVSGYRRNPSLHPPVGRESHLPDASKNNSAHSWSIILDKVRRIYGAFILICFMHLVPFYALADSPAGLKQLRQKMIVALNSSKTTDSLYTALDRMSNKPPVYLAYQGTLCGLKAKHSWNPYSKLKYLNTAEKVLNQAAAADPHNIEIRFLRFSIEHNVPGFLGYNKNLAADRQEMIEQLNDKNYGTANKELTIRIIKFLIDSKRCTPAENEALHTQLASL